MKLPWGCLLLGALPLLLWSRAPAAANGVEIVEKSDQALYYAGTDMKARVTMELITAHGGKRTRVLTMLRRNGPKRGDQRYYIYFHQPGDIRGTAFLVWKYPEKDDDRWIFIPAVNMVRRVAASDSRSSFFGSDFNYEDMSGRDVRNDTHTLLREDELDGTDCYVVESVPRTSAEYVKELSWIAKTDFLPRREEYYDAQNELARVFTADRVETIGGYATVVKRTMKNAKSGHRTVVTLKQVAYGLGLPANIFTLRSLRQLPRKWIR